MAFNIYSGSAAGSNKANDLIDKLIELWDFDEVDQESQYHSATYGSATIVAGANNVIYLKDSSGTTVQSASFNYSPHYFTVAAAENAVLVSFQSDNANSAYTAVVFGRLKNIDGRTGKGAVIVNSVQTANAGMVTDSWSSGSSAVMNEQMRFSDGLTQLIPYAATQGGWYFENAHRMMVGTAYNSRGLYLIGDDRYYISQRTAIKET